ncbi:hypothetical protein NLM31_24925 [Bradyrhizobium sp. CCGUVB4N]|uniref:hypothetical protein n=1 Tax=Bradyrhizobium sp. CCGUVB4N TaxID=2949631 RepID=UPI0020B20F2A|nr:hypothetical protein [Bradyrhizobium sp. CCGUVB4N]MCP3383617.1 hypothetical protein [Bradyrhizobium sp. CCGUVB4N]
MKASEVISRLQAVVNNRGDLEVFVGHHKGLIRDIHFCRDEEMLEGDFITIATESFIIQRTVPDDPA